MDNLDEIISEGPTAGLAHTLKSRHVTMISFGGIIGAGVFIGSSGAIAKGGPGVALTYAACGLLVFLIMRMLGEMAVARPGRGSFAEYSALALGPWAGFATLVDREYERTHADAGGAVDGVNGKGEGFGHFEIRVRRGRGGPRH